MIRFLVKGLLRDKSRSRLPVIVVSIGVMLTVFLHAYITGFMGDTIEMNARFSFGHVKIMTRAYAEEMDQVPNDLALVGASDMLDELKELYPGMEWAARIQFGGLIDAPDESGETKAQGPAMGLGLDLFSPDSREAERLNLAGSMVRGTMPDNRGEVLISENFSRRLQVDPGDEITLIGSSMYGGMVMHNFRVSGTLVFGIEIMDRGTIIADIEDIRLALDMDDAAGEIIGFLPDGFYDDDIAVRMASDFNGMYSDDEDEFTPVMKSLSQQGTMGPYVEMAGYWSWYLTMIFIIAMSLVLWNAGLLGGLRRYGEIGIRIAMGEEKGHIYRSMIWESVFIGFTGTIIGTGFGLLFAYIVQVRGIDISGMMEGASLMMPDTIRTRITPADYYIGLIPGLLSTVTGTMLAGIGIFKRETARLFKELEA
ncbi:MAG: FtsX-like permease family protein [Bacteroidales bacterium]